MKNLNCEMYEFTVRFDEANFNKEQFKKDFGCEDETHNAFDSHYYNKGKRKIDHAHLEVKVDGEDSRFEATFHAGKFESNLIEPDETPLEDAVKKFSGYLDVLEYTATVTAIFRFDDTFEPLLQLDYPLLVGSKDLRNAVVSGHEILFDIDESRGGRAFIAIRRDSIAVILNIVKNLNLASFDVYAEIEDVSKYTKVLVKKEEETHE